MLQIWDLWYPEGAAQGLSFARGRLDATDRLPVLLGGGEVGLLISWWNSAAR